MAEEFSIQQKLVSALMEGKPSEFKRALIDVKSRVSPDVFARVLLDIAIRHPDLAKRMREENSTSLSEMEANEEIEVAHKNLPPLSISGTLIVQKTPDKEHVPLNMSLPVSVRIAKKQRYWEKVFSMEYRRAGSCPVEVQRARYQWDALDRVAHLDPIAIRELKQLNIQGLDAQVVSELKTLQDQFNSMAQKIGIVLRETDMMLP